MYDFFGIKCAEPTVWRALELLMWGQAAIVAYLLWRVRKLKEALAVKTAPPQAAAATRRDDQGGGRTWDIGATGPARSPRAPERRGG